jgi:hypothetical protein
MLIATGLLVGSFFLASFALQRGLGWSALQTGFAFLPMAVATLAGAHAAAHGIAHLGSRHLAVAAFALAALGLAAAFMVQQPLILLAGLTVASAGIGAAFVAAGVTALSHMEQGTAGVTSALLNTAHEIGGAATVAVLTAIAAGAPGAGFVGLAATALATTAAMMALMPGVRPEAGTAPFVH